MSQDGAAQATIRAGTAGAPACRRENRARSGVDALLAGPRHPMVPAVQELRAALLDGAGGLARHVP